MILPFLCVALLFSVSLFAAPAPVTAEVKSLSVNGGLEDGKGKLIIEAQFQGLDAARAKPIFATALQHSIQVTLEKLTHSFLLQMDVLQGEPKEIALFLSGEGQIRSVTGERLQDWSLREESGGSRFLVLRPKPSETPLTNWLVTVTAETELKDLPQSITPLTISSPQAGLLQGFARVEAAPTIFVAIPNPAGAVPIEDKYLPDRLRKNPALADSEPLAFRLLGAGYALPMTLTPADPEARRVVLRNVKLTGQFTNQTAAFTFTATAQVKAPAGGTLALLSGGVALTDLVAQPGWRMRLDDGRFVLVFDKPGEFPITLQFTAAVRQGEGWNSVNFHLAPSALQPITLQGLAADTQFQFANAARPERKGETFVSFLPADGAVRLAWKEARKEEEGKLFFAAGMLSQITVSSGLMRQVALLDFKVMQGELSRVTLLLRGAGEVTRVQGEQVLAWRVEELHTLQSVSSDTSDRSGASDRRLIIQLNQPQKDGFTVQVQLQTPLGAFPQTAQAIHLQPEAATRFAGYFRIVNEGAVRLEVSQASGLSQISPEQFPESDATRAALRASGSQRFAYRFSSADYALRLQADQILPELTVSQVLAYHHGQNELTIEAEIELDVREAPLRELLLRVPKGYAIARLNASGMNDYFLREPAGEAEAELRLVYGQPVSGRQVVQLRLERNKPLAEADWVLPRVEVTKAKSVRGNLGVSADAGFRLTAGRTEALTEIATAFFPRKVANLQASFRLSDPAWQATMRVERLPQTVTADGFHLFSIGEGIAYGSSVMNYLISGAPVAAFRVELSDEYSNVEFTGKDVRNWQKTTNGYVVQLHSPVAGAFTLLATYERPFKPQGETLAFTGARPLDAQSESGHTLVISAYQFQVKPAEVSSGLLPLETGEVPAEYRLFFDAPILAAYRYTARPFNLKLALSPLAQGDSLSQVVDRASLLTRISKEGQVLTDVSYLVKNRGNPNFRLTLPAGVELWSATVNGASVVPVKDGEANLIPLPQRADPNAVLKLDLKLASKSKAPERVTVAAPIVNAPVMLAEWKLQPDAGQRLAFVKGSLTPAGGLLDVSGFAQLTRMFGGDRSRRGNEADFRDPGPGRLLTSAATVIVLVLAALIVWRWASRAGVTKFSAQHMIGAGLGLVAVGTAAIALAGVFQLAEQRRGLWPGDVSFLAPVQQAGSALSVEVANVSEKTSGFSLVGSLWPGLIALLVWLASWLAEAAWKKSVAQMLGWLFLAWAALRFPNGVPGFLVVLIAFLCLRVLIPALWRLWTVPQKPDADRGAVTAAAMLLVLGLILVRSSNSALAAAPVMKAGWHSPVPEQISQQVRVEDQFVFATAKVRWQAEKGQMLPLLFEPAVLTQISYPKADLALVQTLDGGKRSQQLIAQQSGTFEIEVTYQVTVTKRAQESGFALPTRHGLVNQLQLTVAGLDVDVFSPQAVAIQRELTGSNTVASLVLAPVSDAWIGWKPRRRDVQREKPVFYAELSQLYVPSAGVIEGAHLVAIRPAQGELGELIFDVPRGATITDVADGSRRRAEADSRGSTEQSVRLLTSAATNSAVSLWRFDPDTRKLRVTLSRAQSRPFTLLVRSQVATGTLPFEQSVGLLSVDHAANQIGVLGIATGNEVQLDTVGAANFSPINLEDFPGEVAQSLAAEIPGLTVRRAFRYSEAKATAALKASPVEPDVRVETQATLSLGEDRMVLAANVTVDITRAGIFKLSFVMPAGFDVEAISGEALSHWTESGSTGDSPVPSGDSPDGTGRSVQANGDGRSAALRSAVPVGGSPTGAGGSPAPPGGRRVITLNLRGKTEGRQQFAINLAGPGVKGSRKGDAWTVPQLVLREAGKQQGTLLIVPEQGMQLQATTMDGLSQLDPQKSGIRQKGVLAFRVLQAPWKLALDLEQVDPWIQVTSLQHATVTEALMRVAANLQYQIENTGLKSLHVSIPTNAESVRFTGELVSDYLRVPGAVTNGLQQWEVKLQRRVIGQYLLQVAYQMLIADQAAETVLRGVQANDANLQRGFVTIQTGGRVQVSVDAANAALQPTEWQSIPRALQQNLQAVSANFAFRLVEPVFQLPLKLDRHEAVKLLPARVNNITFTSVISDAGVMLTQARLEMLPGDKRLLSVKLPKDARYWFAFVNQNGVWPWRQGDEILIPLEPSSGTSVSSAGGRQAGSLPHYKPVPVEIFYTSQVGKPGSSSLDLELFAPKFDLPLENITWRVYLNDKWKVDKWTGTLQLQEQQVTPVAATLNLQGYLENEAALQRGKTQEAEQMLALGNTALEKGDPQQARRAFQSAYGLSTHDNAFNEDARVQLHNLKLQQALVGLNVRQAATAGDPGALGGRFRDLRGAKELNYTQQDAKGIIDRNTADDNAATMRLAEKLIQQQDAAVASAAAIRANIPEHGRVLTFQRAVAVDREADLRIGIAASAVRTASWGVRVLILGGTLVLLLAFGLMAQTLRRSAGA